MRRRLLGQLAVMVVCATAIVAGFPGVSVALAARRVPTASTPCPAKVARKHRAKKAKAKKAVGKPTSLTGFTIPFMITVPPSGWNLIPGRDPSNGSGYSLDTGNTSQAPHTVSFIVPGDGSPAATVLANIRGASGYFDTEPAAGCLGNLPAQAFNMTLAVPDQPGAAFVTIGNGLTYGLSPGDAGRILVADASGRALVVVEEGPAAEINSFVKTAQPLLNSVRF